jgi:hypothetical protein
MVSKDFIWEHKHETTYHTSDGILGFYLSENEGWKDSDLEDDENAVLKRRPRIVKLKVHKTSQESDDNVVKQASESVVGRPPETQVLALDDLLDLERHRGSVFLLRHSLSGANFCGTCFFDVDDMALDFCKFLRVGPNVSPVAVTDAVSRTSTYSVKHPLSRIGGRRTISTMAMEVFE